LAALLWLLVATAAGLLGCAEPAGEREPPPAGEKAPPPPLVPLSYQGRWVYQYGESPRLPSGEFLWAQPPLQGDLATDGWRESGAFRRFAGRDGNVILWVRTRLHGLPLRDGVLYLAGVDNLLEAYLDGRLVYRFGDMSGAPPYRFRGYRTHLIPIGSDYEGKTLALRVYSNLPNIGPIGEPRLGERAEITEDLFREDLPRVIVAALLIVLGLAVLVLYSLRREERTYFFYGGFTITIGVYILTQLQVRSMILDMPLLWVHVELASLYAIMVFLYAFIAQVFGRGPLGLTRLLCQIHIAFLLGSAVIVAAQLVSPWQTLLPFQLMMIFDALYLSFAILFPAMRGSTEARILAIGFLIAIAIAVYDVLGALRIIPRLRLTMSHYGSVAFTLSLGAILGRRFVLLHRRLRDYSSVLQLSLASASVLDPDERTQVALDDLVRLLQARRALLFLTQPSGEELAFSAGRDDQKRSLGSADRVDMSLIEQARARQKPVGQRTTALGKSTGRHALGNLMAAPLLARGQLLGVLYLEGDSGRRIFQEEDLDILLGLANQVAVSIVAGRAIKFELESAMTRQRFEEQRSLLDAAVRMASGDLTSPIQVPQGSNFQHLAAALESMRRDLWAKLAMLETRNREIQSLNEELRRQIEQRSRRLMANIMNRQGGKAPALTSLDPGKILVGRYKVHRPIGRGAMGAVYEVERTSDGKRLAAKLLSTRADKSSLLRFTREAQILARLSHRNLIGIADIDMTAGGVLFIVLELVSGGNLLALRHRFGDTRWALCVLRQICDALAAIHEAGIVHRGLSSIKSPSRACDIGLASEKIRKNEIQAALRRE
jgi:HAMP domain-containing protein